MARGGASQCRGLPSVAHFTPPPPLTCLQLHPHLRMRSTVLCLEGILASPSCPWRAEPGEFLPPPRSRAGQAAPLWNPLPRTDRSREEAPWQGDGSRAGRLPADQPQHWGQEEGLGRGLHCQELGGAPLCFGGSGSDSPPPPQLPCFSSHLLLKERKCATEAQVKGLVNRTHFCPPPVSGGTKACPTELRCPSLPPPPPCSTLNCAQKATGPALGAGVFLSMSQPEPISACTAHSGPATASKWSSRQPQIQHPAVVELRVDYCPIVWRAP